MNGNLFLSEVFPAEMPVQVKLIDLESGETFLRNLGVFVDNPNLLSKLSSRDKACLTTLINQQVSG